MPKIVFVGRMGWLAANTKTKRKKTLKKVKKGHKNNIVLVGRMGWLVANTKTKRKKTQKKTLLNDE